MSTEQTRVDEWNKAHPIGTAVHAWPGNRHGRKLSTVTRSAAWLLGGHSAVVAVRDFPGGIALSHVDPIDDTLRDLAREVVASWRRLEARGDLLDAATGRWMDMLAEELVS